MAEGKEATKEKNLSLVIEELTRNRKLTKEEVVEGLERGLLEAYKRKFRSIDNVKVKIDIEKGEIFYVVEKEVAKEVLSPALQISLEEAKKFSPNVQEGEKIEISYRPEDFGRGFLYQAMQSMIREIRSIEQDKVLEKYQGKVGEILTGYVLRKKQDTVYIDLGELEGIMPPRHQIPGERYRAQDRIKVLLYSLEKDLMYQEVKAILSRADRRFIQKLFALEVPEISQGIVEIKAISRVPGVRTKIVVYSHRSDVDPVGACVGMQGMRIQNILREIGRERIDIIPYKEDPAEFIKQALTPSKPVFVRVQPKSRKALVVVPDRELSQAIGKEGINIRLASQITGYQIELKTESEFSREVASPEARKKFEELFSPVRKKEEESKPPEEEEGTSIDVLEGLSKRVKKILKENGIFYIEDLLEKEEEELAQIEGIGKSTAKQIIEVLLQEVEIEEEEEEEKEE